MRSILLLLLAAMSGFCYAADSSKMSAAQAFKDVGEKIAPYQTQGTIILHEFAVWPQAQAGQPCTSKLAGSGLILSATNPNSDGATAQEPFEFSKSDTITKTVNGNETDYTWSGKVTPDGPGSGITVHGFLGLTETANGLQIAVGDSRSSSSSCEFKKK